MNNFKQEKRFDLELSDTSYSTTEDLLTRVTTEYFENKVVAETTEFSSRLETFIRHIVQEEFKKVMNSMLKGQGLVEYALILVLVAVVVIVILALLGPAIGNIFSNLVNAL